MKMFSIEEDLLGLVSFLVMGGSGSSQYGAGINFLRHISRDLKPEQIGNHIVQLAIDNLGSYYETYCDFVTGDKTLTTEQDRWLRDRGFLFGKDPKAPRLVVEFCQLRKETFKKLKEIK